MRIDSEIAPLRKVILHRPGLALHRLTPSNHDELLFDDILWPEKAAEEHAYFSATLESNDVEVYFLNNLLSETMENPEARDWVLRYILKRLYVESDFRGMLYEFLDNLSANDLAKHLIGGLTWGEMQIMCENLVCHFFEKHSFVLPPLPNHYFTRDTSCWIGKGVSINPMCKPARRGETINVAAIYKFHPMFADADFETWIDGSAIKQEFHSIEGGDVLVINKDCVLIGVSERTNPQTITTIAKKLFAAEDKKKVIAIEIPKTRASMHLDTIMTMVDHDAFCTAFSDDCTNIRHWTLSPTNDNDHLLVRQGKNLETTLAEALDLKKIRMLEISEDKFIKEREQWTDGSNFLTIAPGKVIGYECNVHSNATLEKAGIEVIPIPGSELGRGRGGARCMSCPIERDEIS